MPGGYRVRVTGGQVYQAKALVVATGANARRLNVPGEKEYTMRGLCYSAISYCRKSPRRSGRGAKGAVS